MKTPTMAKTAIYAAVAKRSITINGRSTSISLEPDFWNAIKDFALKNHITIPEVIASIDKERGEANMSSAVRVFCFRQAKTQEGWQSFKATTHLCNIEYTMWVLRKNDMAALNSRDPEEHSLAKRLADFTNSSLTDAVTDAVKHASGYYPAHQHQNRA